MKESFKAAFGTVLGVFAGLWTVDAIGRAIKHCVGNSEGVKPEKTKEDLWEESVK